MISASFLAWRGVGMSPDAPAVDTLLPPTRGRDPSSADDFLSLWNVLWLVGELCVSCVCVCVRVCACVCVAEGCFLMQR